MADCTVVTPVNSTDYVLCYEHFPEPTYLMSALTAVSAALQR